jgi:hypothetical protein
MCGSFSADNATHHHGKSESDGERATDQGLRTILCEPLDLRDDIAAGGIGRGARRGQLGIRHRRLADGVEIARRLFVVRRLGWRVGHERFAPESVRLPVTAAALTVI